MIDRVCSQIKMQIPERNRGLLFSSGTTVPTDGTDGYQTGCIFQKTDGGDGTALYINEGSVTTCDFNAVGDLTTVDYSAGGATAITISGTYTVEGISITNASVHGIRVGAFASSGSTASAMVLDGTTSTAVEIHAGVSTDPGSGSNLRPLRSRFIVNTSGNVEAETYGIQGQLVVKSSNLGHWHGGVMGTIECQTALSVYNPLAGVGALVGRIGGSTITVQSDCYLAGVIALASSVGVSNSGTYAGLYVTKTSGATDFSHGIFIDGPSVSCGISVGKYASSYALGSAVVMGTTHAAACAIFGETAADLTSAYMTRAIRGRHTVNVSGAVNQETYGVQGQLCVKSATLGHLHAGVLGTFEASTSVTLNAGVGGYAFGHACVIARPGGMTNITATTPLSGFLAWRQDGALNSGSAYAFTAHSHSGWTNWDVGLYVDGATVGIEIAGTMLADETRTNKALVIGARGAAKTVTFASGTSAAENFEPIQMNFACGGANPDATSTVNVWQGSITHTSVAMAALRLKWTDLLTTVSKNAKDVYVHQAEIVLSGTTTISGEVAVLGLVLDAGSGTITCTAYRGINVTMRGSGTPANAQGLFLNCVAGVTIASAIHLEANGTITTGIVLDSVPGVGTFTNLLAVDITNGPAVATVKANDADGGSIRILVDGAAKWLHYWSAAS